MRCLLFELMTLASRIWSLSRSVGKLAVWACMWIVSAAALCLHKCRPHLCRTYHSSSLTSRTVMATASEGAGDTSLVDKIAKNVVQNVKSKEVRVH